MMRNDAVSLGQPHLLIDLDQLPPRAYCHSHLSLLHLSSHGQATHKSGEILHSGPELEFGWQSSAHVHMDDGFTRH